MSVDEATPMVAVAWRAASCSAVSASYRWGEVGLPRGSVLPRVRASRRRRVGAHGCDALRPSPGPKSAPACSAALLLCGAAPAPRADPPLALWRPRGLVAEGSLGARSNVILASVLQAARPRFGWLPPRLSTCSAVHCCTSLLLHKALLTLGSPRAAPLLLALPGLLDSY